MGIWLEDVVIEQTDIISRTITLHRFCTVSRQFFFDYMRHRKSQKPVNVLLALPDHDVMLKSQLRSVDHIQGIRLLIRSGMARKQINHQVSTSDTKSQAVPAPLVMSHEVK